MAFPEQRTKLFRTGVQQNLTVKRQKKKKIQNLKIKLKKKIKGSVPKRQLQRCFLELCSLLSHT